jgi:hypothetical protein
VCKDGAIVGFLKEPLACVVFCEHRHEGPMVEVSRLHGEGVHPLECAQFAIDLGVFGARLLTFDRECSDV